MSDSDIISFYRDLELLEIPSAGFPKDSRWQWTREVDFDAENLPIRHQNDVVGMDVPYYRLFLGCPKQADLINAVARSICGRAGVEDFLEEKVGGNRGALATMTVDWAGRLVAGTVRVAPFVFACARLASGEDMSGVQTEIDDFERRSEAYLGDDFDHRHKSLTVWNMQRDHLMESEKNAIESGDVKEYARLEELRVHLEMQDIKIASRSVDIFRLRAIIRRLADMIDMPGSLPLLVTETGRKWREGRLFPRPPAAENFKSFYFEEIDRILSNVPGNLEKGSVLGTFLSPGSEVNKRVEVMKADAEITKRMDAGSFAQARWPSNPKHSLSLAQQIGVHDALDNATPITAVNGPPGTGKTTLLRDVIANKVVTRALRLSALKRPGDAFSVKKGIAIAKDGLVDGTEIVIASNGNRAVENVTLEIPKSIEIDTSTFEDAAYLPEAAEAVAIAFERPSESWGLIALAMGKKSNISKTMSALRNGARGPNKKDHRVGLIGALEARGKLKKGEWKIATSQFQASIEAFREIMRRRSVGEDASSFLTVEEVLKLSDEGYRHATSVWSDPDLEELRAQIFLQALKVHELILRTKADGLNQFLEEFEAVLTGDREASLERQVQLWRTFFLISPVVSTTFASMRRFPRLEGWIGCLMIDEAGQATPQSAVPALYRAKKAVVVGDPAQLQPIFTVPMAVINALRERQKVSLDLCPSIQSVQSISDAKMKIGGYLPDPIRPASRRWSGIPLRVHRRCAQPMFDIINKISYDGQMVSSGDLKAAAQKMQFPFRYSQWFDVRASSGRGHVVKAEMECLEDVLTRFRDAGVLGPGKTATAMVVTPFARVQSSARKVIRNVFGKAYFDIEAGTIHKFQGREADIVFLVLGSAPGQNGLRSREWAAMNPNMLNVAVSRAKTKLFVIGSHKDWSVMKNFDVMSNSFSGTNYNLVQRYAPRIEAKQDSLLSLL